ncbi:MAG: hypothetical protein AAF518_03505 [Spirochaetota bacterium]
MKLNCPECGHPIVAEDINLSTVLAKCSNCHAVFSFAGDIQKKPVRTLSSSDEFFASHSYSEKERPMVPLPKGIEFAQSPDGLTIQFRWFRWTYVFMAFFSLFWNGFMAVWMWITITQGIYAFSIFGCLHAGVGIYLAYNTITGFFNKTIIKANRQTLSIRHTPLPWPGKRDIDSQDLSQLYSKAAISRNRNSTSVSYQVHAIAKNNTHISLVKNLESSEQALYIEQAIENHLGIEDRAVKGEIA